MLTLKKMIITLSSITSGMVFAGTMGPVCSPENVTIPCETRAWDVGVEALYLKAVYNQAHGYLGQSTGFSEKFPTANSSITTHSTDFIEPPTRWGFGFKLHGSYHLHSGKDIYLNWSHYSKTGSSTQNMNQFFLDYKNVPTNSTVKPQWDAVNLEFGQQIDLGEPAHIRYHGGVQYARIKGTFNLTQLVPVQTPSETTTQTFDDDTSKTSTFNGFGPRIGTDLSYDLPHSFGVYAKGAAVLLIGTQKSNFLNYFTEKTDSSSDINILQRTSSKSALLPELEASLGMTYTHPLSSGNLSVNLGYMWLNYFNASDFPAGTSDFALHGVNAGLKWVG